MIVSLAVGILAAVLAIRVVRRISALQEEARLTARTVETDRALLTEPGLEPA